MTISDQFKSQPWYERLRKRGPNFARMIEHVCASNSRTIIETGCSRSENNWEGEGHSTYIWDWLAELIPVSVESIDITAEHIALSKKNTSRVKYHLGDSVKVLSEMDVSNCALLYLDSYDWAPQINIESAFHHVAELTAVWRALPSGCMIAVDDRHGNMQGKHWMVEKFMEQIGLKPVFKNCQIGWVKP